jgi:hypothetical protein
LVAKNTDGCSQKNLHSYVACNQIWLNVGMDDCHFGQKKKNHKIDQKNIGEIEER